MGRDGIRLRVNVQGQAWVYKYFNVLKVIVVKIEMGNWIKLKRSYWISLIY